MSLKVVMSFWNYQWGDFKEICIDSFFFSLLLPFLAQSCRTELGGGVRGKRPQMTEKFFCLSLCSLCCTLPHFFSFILLYSELGHRLSRWKRLEPPLRLHLHLHHLLLHSHTLCLSASLIGHIQNQQAEKQSVTSFHSSKHRLGLTHAQHTCVECVCVSVSLFPA